MDPPQHFHSWNQIAVKHYTGKGEATPKMAKTIPSTDTVMASDFWDPRGIIFNNYLEKKKTMMYYVWVRELPANLNEEIMENSHI